jgi:peptide/nickel transport system permease protein
MIGSQQIKGAANVANPRRSIRRAIRRNAFVRQLRANPAGLIGLVMLVVILIAAAFPELFTNQSPVKLNFAQRLLPPSWDHPFGTDDTGRDVFARVLYGGRTTLASTALVLVLAATTGTVIGSVAGFFGGLVDGAIMRITDMFLAFPPLVLALAINAALGRGLTQAMIAVAITWWPGYARLIRGQVLSVKESEFVTASRVTGSGSSRILFRHILPNSMQPIIVRMTLDVGFITLTTAGLSFLGLGVEPPTPEWGRMVADGRNFLLDQWWIATFPGFAIFLVVVGSNLLGDVIREATDPRMKSR